MAEVKAVWIERDTAPVRAGWRRVRALWFGVTLGLVLSPSVYGAEASVTEAVVNAPIEKVWDVFTTAAGYEALGAAQADVDLRLGGRIRTHPDATSTPGDIGSTEREILAYDPPHMLATRPVQVPADFPHREAYVKTWTVIYLNSIAGETTHVRIVALGYDDSPAAQAARTATDQRHRATLDRLVKHYRPQCAHCAKPQ